MRYYIVNFFLRILPASRFYGLKRALLRFAGAKVGGNVRVMKIIVNGVRLEIGENTFIGNYTMITGAPGTRVAIGRDCDISDRVNICTGSHRLGTAGHAAGEGYGEDVVIADGVWIGIGATVLPGVTVGKGAVVAACACVRDEVAPGTLVAGVPATFKKQLFGQ